MARSKGRTVFLRAASRALLSFRNFHFGHTFTQSGRWAPPESEQAASMILCDHEAKLVRSVFVLNKRFAAVWAGSANGVAALDNSATLPLDYVVCNMRAVPSCGRSK